MISAIGALSTEPSHGRFGSGHTFWDKKRQLEDCWPLGADSLARAGLFTRSTETTIGYTGREWRDGSKIGFRVNLSGDHVLLALLCARVRTDRETGQDVRDAFEQTVLVEPLMTSWGARR
jgi:hypothetical protein